MWGKRGLAQRAGGPLVFFLLLFRLLAVILPAAHGHKQAPMRGNSFFPLFPFVAAGGRGDFQISM